MAPIPSSSCRTSITRVEDDEGGRTSESGTGGVVPTPIAAGSHPLSLSHTPSLDTPALLSHPRVPSPPEPAAFLMSTSTTTMSSTPPPNPQPPIVPVSIPAPVSAPVTVPQTPQTYLTFLLISGKRRTMAFDPETTIARVKELAWNSWPGDADWQDDRPPAPSYLRVLYLGRMLQDDETLSNLKLPTYTPPASSSSAVPLPPPSPTIPTIQPSPSVSEEQESQNAPSLQSQSAPPPPPPHSVPGPVPTIMHLSIRPYAPAPGDGDGALKKKKRRIAGLGGLAADGNTGNGGVGGREGEGAEGEGRGRRREGREEAGCCGCVVC